MYDNKLFLNEKLFSFDGAIGRYGYLLNFVIISALSVLFMFPYTSYILTHTENFFDLFITYKLFYEANIILQLWVLLTSVGICLLSVSNIYRRLNDLFGQVNNSIAIPLCFISALASFSFLMPFGYSVIFSLYSFVFIIILFTVKGKFTKSLEYDFRKEFNWGAFFGAWIWGLFNKSYIPFWGLLLFFIPFGFYFNKSYIPLWELLLFFTLFGFYFQMYCGLKGNEWAFKNKNCTDVEEFNDSQKNQSIVFTILSLVAFPVLYMILIFVLIFALILSAAVLSSSSKNMSPEQRKAQIEKFESRLNTFMDFALSIYFERYEFTDAENKFYVTDFDWKTSTFKDKKDMLELAATKSAEYRRSEFKAKNPDGYKHFSKYSELPRTKIYSVETGKLLGEFSADENIPDKSFTEAVKSAFKAYKFYNVK